MKIKRFVGGNLESNGYVINTEQGKTCYIIDPGYEPQKFTDYIQKSGLIPRGIILTHHHHDHVGGAAKLRDCFDIPVLMHENDSWRYRGRTDVMLSDGDFVEMDGEKLQILLTPGHTSGSICIVSEKSKVVFTGDTIFDTDLGRTDLEDGSPTDMVKSCREVIDKWSNEYIIYPGHDGSASMKQVRKYNSEFLACLAGV